MRGWVRGRTRVFCGGDLRELEAEKKKPGYPSCGAEEKGLAILGIHEGPVASGTPTLLRREQINSLDSRVRCAASKSNHRCLFQSPGFVTNVH